MPPYCVVILGEQINRRQHWLRSFNLYCLK